VTILQVPYVSQVDGPTAGGHRNDCGPACVAMLLQGKGHAVTIADVYTAIGSMGNAYVNGGQLTRAAAFYGLGLTATHMTIDGLEAEWEAGHAFIALIKYGCLSSLGLTESLFQGPHFVVVLGSTLGGPDEGNKQVVVHDPLYRGQGGAYKRYPARDFWRAWTTESLVGNPVSWGLLTDYAYPASAVPVPVPLLPEPQPAYWGTGVTTGNLKLRRYAPDGPILAWMTPGTDLRILEAPANGWYHVLHGTVEGWAGAAYVRATPIPLPEPAPVPPPGSPTWDDLTGDERDDLLLRLLKDHGMVDADGVIVE